MSTVVARGPRGTSDGAPGDVRAGTTTAPGPGVRRPVGPTRRTVVVVGALVVVLVALGGLALNQGDVPTTLGQVWRALTATGEQDERVTLVVVGLRLPRVLVAVAVGAALGAAGAIFQSLTRNPLGSPDVVGFTAGSATGAILGIVLLGGGSALVAASSVAGGLVCAVAVLALVASGGSTTGYRFVLVGIGVSAVLTAVNGYLLTRAALGDATAAQTWLVGSLNARGWEHVVPLWAAVALLLPVAVAGQRVLAMLEMGDDAATALGVGVVRARWTAVLVGIGLTAVATAAAGPVGFVALASPQLARRLTQASGPGVGSAAAVGAALLVASDVAAQRVLAPVVLPVGVMTGLLGGIYLAWLLWTGRARAGARS